MILAGLCWRAWGGRCLPLPSMSTYVARRMLATARSTGSRTRRQADVLPPELRFLALQSLHQRHTGRVIEALHDDAGVLQLRSASARAAAIRTCLIGCSMDHRCHVLPIVATFSGSAAWLLADACDASLAAAVAEPWTTLRP